MKLPQLKDKRIKLFILSVMHFATDGLCSYLVFAKLYADNLRLAFAIFIIYNLLAFVVQSPLGILIDKYNFPKLFLSIGVTAIILGYAFSNLCFVSVFFIGIGNAAFHIAGGKYVTDKSGNNVSYLGIFVSTGALGLTIGQIYSTFNHVLYILFSILIICALLMILSKDTENQEYSEEYSPKRLCAASALLLVIAVVFMRAFVGKVACADFELTKFAFLIIAISTMLGKALSGIICRLIGTSATAIISLSISALCLSLGCSNIYIYIIGIFAFNFSMPITLYFANIILKGREGFAFGTLAATLFPGYLIAMCFTYLTWVKILTAVLSLSSALVICIISKRIKHADKSVISNTVN